jgi:hypothetical protein
MVLAPDLISVNYQLRAANGVVYVMGIAKSRAELDQVIALARESGARRIVSHVFLTEHITLDGASETAAAAKVESESARAGVEPARAGPQTDEIKTKPDANRAKKKPVARSGPARNVAP